MIPPFELRRASSVAEAVELLALEDAHALAGGTALVLLMKQGLLRPARLVSLAGLREFSGIERLANGDLRIGALATHREIEGSALVREHCAALAEAFARVATPRIRAQATIGGSLAHADPAQDPPPMLMGLGAVAVLESTAGRRILPVEELFVDVFETRIGRAELVREIVVPPLAPGSRATYLKYLPRTEDDYATVAVAAFVTLDADRRCADIRVALGSAGPTPLRARRTEDALRGEVMTPERIREATAMVREEVDPLEDARGSIAYKREMARVWTERALLQLLAPADSPPVARAS